MNDKRTFVDSNIILYLFTDDTRKKEIIVSMFSARYIISTQVVGENVNVCLKKLRLGKADAFAHAKNLLAVFTVANIFSSTINSAFELSLKYGFSYWDALIVATALENKCSVLLSEDMQHGLIVEGVLTITNPFRANE
jgi:predicted nucleic acid-binding protein